MLYTEDDLKRLHSLSVNNRESIVSDVQQCGCFCCLSIFQSSYIKDWTDKGNTALCPECGVDSVLIDGRKNNDFVTVLCSMQKRWFGLN